MTRDLKLHGVIDDDPKSCAIWIEDDGRIISNKVSGVKLLNLTDFFNKHRLLMPNTLPSDFITWLATSHDEMVSIADDPAAYRELTLTYS